MNDVAGAQDLSLIDLIHVFRIGSRSGIVQLLHGDEHGVIYLAIGQIVDATLARGPERTVVATRDEAVIQMLSWRDATLRFQHDLTVGRRQVRVEHDGDWLAREALRRRGFSEMPARMSGLNLDLPVRITLQSNNARNGVLLTATQWCVLSHVARGRSLHAACDASGYTTDTILQAVAKLLDLGLLEVIAVPDPQPRVPRTPGQRGTDGPFYGSASLGAPPSGRVGRPLAMDVAPERMEMPISMEAVPATPPMAQPAAPIAAPREAGPLPAARAQPGAPTGKRGMLAAIMGRIRSL